MLVVEPVQAAIWHCLNHYAYRDATFLAERLRAEVDSEESLFLVATCYYRAGRLDQAHHLLQSAGARTSQNKFLLAKCAADLSKDSEAESVLRGAGADPRKEVGLEEMVARFGDRTAFALQILSGIYHRSERSVKGAELDRKALKLNPFLWFCYENLSNAGEICDPTNIWDPDTFDNFSHCTGTNPLMNLINSGSISSSKSEPLKTNTLSTPVTVVPMPKLTSSVQQQSPGQPETPLLYCNSLSTPMGQSPTIGQPLSGISSLNITNDIDSSIPPQVKPVHFMAPPLRPKQRRNTLRPDISPNFGVFKRSQVSPNFGVFNPTPSPAIAAKLLEFSSPQVMMLSPVPSHTPSPVMVLKSGPILSTPAPPLRSSTPGVQTGEDIRPIKRIAMATHKPTDPNLKPLVLAPTPANMITPSPVNLQPRRSSRLFGSTQSVKENSKAPNKGSRLKSKSRTLSQSNKQLSENELNEKNKQEKEKISILEPDLKPEPSLPMTRISPVNLNCEATKLQKASVTGLLQLLRQLGAVYQEVGKYNCKEAIRLLKLIPPRHLNTPWVLALLGKCYFELAEYREAVKYFSQVREIDPYRMSMMEFYSTALWHLQEEVELSALSQDLQMIDKSSAAAWCAAGNCFSHQKEHENAIKFFQRAVQVSPGFAYAYTLLGHEYVLVEELDKALSCFRTAVRLDSRHYNSWYGIGLTYYKQERFQLAEIYYRKALAINPHSPVLMCHVAVVQHATNNTGAALDTLNTAIKTSPKNPLCKFERASILHSIERYQDALAELNDLKQIVPKESPVYFLMGKVHNKLGNTHLALMHFSWAMDLDPKGANSQIKDALDPAINRMGQDLGGTGQESGDGEEMSGGQHEDFQGEISEGFDPPAGENVVSLESPSVPVLHDSDDSL